MAKATKKAAPKVERVRDEQNGIVRPKAGTKTAKVWDFADKAAAKSGPQNIDRADVVAKATAAGLNAATIATQFQNWRVYHGLQGRSGAKAPKPPKAKKAASKKAAPAKKASSKRAPKAPPAPPAEANA
jgi:hypothetical protein